MYVNRGIFVPANYFITTGVTRGFGARVASVLFQFALCSRPEGASDVLSGAAVDEVGIDVSLK